MRAIFSRLRIGAWLLAVFALAVFHASAKAVNPTGPVKVKVEVITATAGDIVNSGIPLEYMPFSVSGDIPTNTPENSSDSLAMVHDKAEASLRDYLKTHGKVLYKASLTTRDQKPATVLVSEPIKGASTGLEPGGPPWDVKTVGMRFELGLTSVLEPTRDLQLLDMDTFTTGDKVASSSAAPQVFAPSSGYCLTIDLAGGVKENDTTVIYVQRLEENITPVGGSFAVGGLASTKAISVKGVPLFTDGLTRDGGFGAADPKAPVLFVFVTPG